MGGLGFDPTERYLPPLKKGMASTHSGPGHNSRVEMMSVSLYFHICFPAQSEVTLLDRVVVEATNTSNRQFTSHQKKMLCPKFPLHELIDREPLNTHSIGELRSLLPKVAQESRTGIFQTWWTHLLRPIRTADKESVLPSAGGLWLGSLHLEPTSNLMARIPIGLGYSVGEQGIVVYGQSVCFTAPFYFHISLENIDSLLVRMNTGLNTAVRLESANSDAHMNRTNRVIHQRKALITFGVVLIPVWHCKFRLLKLPNIVHGTPPKAYRLNQEDSSKIPDGGQWGLVPSPFKRSARLRGPCIPLRAGMVLRENDDS